MIGKILGAAGGSLTLYQASCWAWASSLGIFGKLGLAFGVVNPPAGLLIGAIGAGAVSLAVVGLATRKDENEEIIDVRVP